MRYLTFRRVILVLSLFAALSRAAQPEIVLKERFDSNTPGAAVAQTDGEQVQQVILRAYDRWNSHDVEGYLAAFWHSPQLLFIVDTDVVWGWDELKQTFARGYPDRSEMGYVQSDRTQVNVLDGNTAIALNWWSIVFRRVRETGVSSINLRKFSDGWRIVSLHTTTDQIPK